MTKKRFRRWCGRAGFILPAVLLLAGCGYHFAGGGDAIDPAIRTIFVETFVNRTSEPRADNFFMSAFANQFVQRGRFRLVSSRAEADAICRGTVLNLQSSSLSYRTANMAAEERLTVTLSIALEENKSGRVIWASENFVGTGDYAVAAAGATEANRRNALIKLAADTAERAYRLMMSGF
jgi:hypothetical protein